MGRSFHCPRCRRRNGSSGHSYVGKTMAGNFGCVIMAPGHVRCDFHDPKDAARPTHSYIGKTMAGDFDCVIMSPGHVRCDYHDPRSAAAARAPNPGRGCFCYNCRRRWGLPPA